MSPEALLARVDQRACLDFLARMVQQKSYTQTEGERELAAFMVDEMEARGLEASLTPVPGGRVNAIGRWRGTGGGKSPLFTPSTAQSTNTIPSSTGSATGSKTRSHASKIGAASTPDTTDALTPSYPRSHSPRPSSSGSISPDPNYN